MRSIGGFFTSFRMQARVVDFDVDPPIKKPAGRSAGGK
jgi:hypothetical protein